MPSLLISQTLIPFEEGEKMGYKDQNNKVVIKPIYDYAMEFSEQGIAAVVINSEWWYINQKGEKLIKPMVVENGPDYFSEGLARFVENDKIGFFDETGKIVIPAQFEYVNPFNSGLAAINVGGYYEQVDEYKLRKGGKWGYINTLGDIVIKAEYDFANDFEQGYASVTNAGHSHYIDTEGNIACDQDVEKLLYGTEQSPEENIEYQED